VLLALGIIAQTLERHMRTAGPDAAAAREGLLEVFAEAGATVLSPGCNTCWGYLGVLSGKEVSITTHQFNYQGRNGSEEARVFLAYEPSAEQLALMLWEDGRPSLFIPPRWAPWPEALRLPLRGFNPELEAQLRWGA
jgi:hypothetical protein